MQLQGTVLPFPEGLGLTYDQVCLFRRSIVTHWHGKNRFNLPIVTFLKWQGYCSPPSVHPAVGTSRRWTTDEFALATDKLAPDDT